MTSNVALVIGDVTDEQYKQARFDVIDMGCNPKIVRLPESEGITGSTSRLSELDFESTLDFEDDEVISEKRYIELANKYARIFFKEVTGVELGRVVAVVIDEATWMDKNNVFVNPSATYFDVYLNVDIFYVTYPDGSIKQM